MKISNSDIITKGYFHLGPNPDQPKMEDRGWFVYPNPGEDRIPVMIVRVKSSP